VNVWLRLVQFFGKARVLVHFGWSIHALFGDSNHGFFGLVSFLVSCMVYCDHYWAGRFFACRLRFETFSEIAANCSRNLASLERHFLHPASRRLSVSVGGIGRTLRRSFLQILPKTQIDSPF